MRGLYAIVDTKLCATRNIDPVAYAKAVLAAKPIALQLRAKDHGAREVLGLLRAIAPLCRNAGVPLVANDRADLAALAGCAAVHIGQGDLPYDLVHRIAPQLDVGISTHNPEQLARALASHPMYVAYGPVFATTNKVNPDPVVGVDGLREASRMSRAAGTPLVAIGGITTESAEEIASVADACAILGDLCPEGASLADVAARARAFQAFFT